MLAPATPYQLADYNILWERGQAYLQAGRADMAERSFKILLENPGIDPVEPLYHLAHLSLARAYVVQHKNIDGQYEYQKFLAIMKDADSDLPLLIQARKEYAALK